jgi:hypothetical protein
LILEDLEGENGFLPCEEFLLEKIVSTNSVENKLTLAKDKIFEVKSILDDVIADKSVSHTLSDKLGRISNALSLDIQEINLIGKEL